MNIDENSKSPVNVINFRSDLYVPRYPKVIVPMIPTIRIIMDKNNVTEKVALL
jgi:hypothetical protein